MPATCAGCDDLCPGRLIVDLVDQMRSDLNREIVFLCERAECARHSAATRVEHGGVSAWQTFCESFHDRRIHERPGVAMRMDRNRRRPIFKTKRVWFLREDVIDKFFK